MTEKDKQEKIRPSRSIARGLDAQREAMQKEREKGEFDPKKHIEESPMGQAIKNGFPLIDRTSKND